MAFMDCYKGWVLFQSADHRSLTRTLEAAILSTDVIDNCFRYATLGGQACALRVN